MYLRLNVDLRSVNFKPVILSTNNPARNPFCDLDKELLRASLMDKARRSASYLINDEIRAVL